MSTIAENLQVIYDIKENIKTAIESKGVGVGDTPFTNYADKIGEITVGGDCEGVYQDGYNNGFNDGFSEGSNVDCSDVWDEAFNQGKTEGKAEGRSEVINNTVSLKITENGKYTATDEKFYKEVVVNVTAEGDGGSYNEGYNNGYNIGYGEGYREGISEGDGTFDEGYTSGYADGVAVNNGGSIKLRKHKATKALSEIDFNTIFTVDCSDVVSLQFLFNSSTFPNEEGFVLEHTENVENFDYLYNYSNIKKPLFFNTNKAKSMTYMFGYCAELEEIPQYNTNAVESYFNMFWECSSLITVPQLYCGNIKMIGTTKPTNYMFYGCTSLTNLGGFVGLTYNLDLSASDLITRESMQNVFNTIGIVEGKTIDISQAVYDRLTTEDIQIATNKGWIINVK